MIHIQIVKVNKSLKKRKKNNNLYKKVRDTILIPDKNMKIMIMTSNNKVK